MKHILPLMLAAIAVISCAGPDSEDAVLASSESAASNTIVVCGLCPPGYTKVSSTCSARCDSPEHPCLPRLGNESTCVPNATGTISANPTNVRINLDVTTLGSTTICWSVSNATTGEVWVAAAGLPEALFTRAPSGCAVAPWFHAGDNMVFRLYEGTAHTKVLASVNVTAEGYHGGTCGPCQSGYSCFCGDRVCRREGTMCP
ncbi:hypothetical protein COCOR_06504 [Corallococcus coralloides DSM 2259]|uniref:Lipoprotein n=1 Tax=Corallococcus coralloides (strain ATCC 25202 / DSM 2259 / NBRC 100086 / M2) TaxID=1144275 RepID=H8MUH9_CORCM|nr:hypothetical protein [Corallococcus coralloides]AFE06960.1 hypothetical protein COCOR_06504 [Corallococcus coralloides DSM 2259]